MTALLTRMLENQIRVVGCMVMFYLLASHVQCLPTTLQTTTEGAGKGGSSQDYTSGFGTTYYQDENDSEFTTPDDNAIDSTTETAGKKHFIILLLFTDWTLLAILAGVEVLAYLFSLVIIYLLKHSGKNSAIPIGRRKPLYRTISWKF